MKIYRLSLLDCAVRSCITTHCCQNLGMSWRGTNAKPFPFMTNKQFHMTGWALNQTGVFPLFPSSDAMAFGTPLIIGGLANNTSALSLVNRRDSSNFVFKVDHVLFFLMTKSKSYNIDHWRACEQLRRGLYFFFTLSCLVTVGLDDTKPGMIGCCFAALLVRSSFFFFFFEAPRCVCKTGATKWDYAAYPTMGLYDNQQETTGLYGGGFNGIMRLFIMVITQSVPCHDLTLAPGPCMHMQGSSLWQIKGS